MAKDSPNTTPKTETPFQRFEALARKVVRVPKRELGKLKQGRGRNNS